MPKTNSKSKMMKPTGALTLFGQPMVLPGEDAGAYNELFARLRAAVKPTDFIYEIYIDDVVTAEWDICGSGA